MIQFPLPMKIEFWPEPKVICPLIVVVPYVETNRVSTTADVVRSPLITLLPAVRKAAPEGVGPRPASEMSRSKVIPVQPPLRKSAPPGELKFDPPFTEAPITDTVVAEFPNCPGLDTTRTPE